MKINQQTFRRTDALLTVTLLAPPVVFLGALELKYMLVHQSCVHGTKLMLFAVDAVAIGACIVAGILARRQVVETDRDLFMSTAAQGLAALFAIVTVAMCIPDFVMRVCD